MIWLTLFLECWKRRSNELAYSWGTLRLVNLPKLNPTFRGMHMDIDPVTKQHVPVYPAYRRHLKVSMLMCLNILLIIYTIKVYITKYIIKFIVCICN